MVELDPAQKQKLAQEAIIQDDSLATRVATDVARALNLSVSKCDANDDDDDDDDDE